MELADLRDGRSEGRTEGVRGEWRERRKVISHYQGQNGTSGYAHLWLKREEGTEQSGQMCTFMCAMCV